MARGEKIIVSANPRGVFMEGTVTGALKPGTCVQIDVSEGMNDQGRFTWEAFNTDADGDQRLVAVLLEDSVGGKIATDAYASGDHCYVYCPIAGEELNMLVGDVSGTGTTEQKVFGDLLMIDDGTGELVDTTGSPEMESFILLEAQDDPISADALLHCMYTGH